MKSSFYKLCKNTNFYILSLLNVFLPKNEKRIVLYGRKMLNDNLEAMLIHFIKEDYISEYKIYCLLAEPSKYEQIYKKDNVFL